MLDVAEQLMSTRGVFTVSLREIRMTAGQRNTSALQFHFGDRGGLLQAIADRHRPRTLQRRMELYEAMRRDGQQRDSRRLIEIFIRPTAEYVFGGSSERAWVRIEAELAARPELTVNDYLSNASPELFDVGVALLDLLEPLMPRRVGFDRLFMTTLASLHMCADRARVEEAAVHARWHMPPTDFVENVIDMALASMFAPVATSSGSRRS